MALYIEPESASCAHLAYDASTGQLVIKQRNR
jgi:hypothetical protein